MEELLLSPEERKELDATSYERRLAFDREVTKDLEALEREMRGPRVPKPQVTAGATPPAR
ncbi:MAG: hypothetical protein ACRC33_20875 [Gemmataceae bacterium]